MIAFPPSLLDQWRRQLGGRRRPSQPRPLAAIGFLTDGAPRDGFIETERLTVVLVYDELIRPEQCAVRMAGYGVSRIPWGIRFGGHAHRRFAKDLVLQPVVGGDG